MKKCAECGKEYSRGGSFCSNTCTYAASHKVIVPSGKGNYKKIEEYEKD